MSLLHFFEWFRTAFFTPLKDHKVSPPILTFTGTGLLAQEGRLCPFKATKFCAMKEVNFFWNRLLCFFLIIDQRYCVFHEQSSYWHAILKLDFIHHDTCWLWNTQLNRVAMKWDWGKMKLESELMPAKGPYLYFIIIIMFNKQSLMFWGKGDNQRHHGGTIKEMP